MQVLAQVWKASAPRGIAVEERPGAGTPEHGPFTTLEAHAS